MVELTEDTELDEVLWGASSTQYLAIFIVTIAGVGISIFWYKKKGPKGA